jgi:hypothetical protein
VSRLATAPFLALLLASCGEKEQPGSRVDPESAAPGTIRQARAVDDPRDPRVVLRESYVRAAAETDPAAREKALESIAWDALDVDPELAREVFAALTPDSESSRRMVGHFAMRLADEDPERALGWARGLEQEQERSDAFGRIAVVISEVDPGRAASLVAQEMSAGPSRDRAVVQILQRWARAAPADAAGWISAFPQGAARGAGLQTVAAAWIEADPAALATWLDSLAAGPLRTEAIHAVATALRPAAPEVRASRLGSFADPALRRQIEGLLSQWPP